MRPPGMCPARRRAAGAVVAHRYALTTPPVCVPRCKSRVVRGLAALRGGSGRSRPALRQPQRQRTPGAPARARNSPARCSRQADSSPPLGSRAPPCSENWLSMERSGPPGAHWQWHRRPRRAGLGRLALAAAGAREAKLVDGVDVVAVDRLASAVRVLNGGTGDRLPPDRGARQKGRAPGQRGPDLGDVRGQQHAVRALVIAAAGGHNCLLSGPPGTGKTMLAHRITSILPALNRQEAIEVARIRSLTGGAGDDADDLATVPRSPSHDHHGWADRRRAARIESGRWSWLTTASSSSTSFLSTRARPSRHSASRSRMGAWRSREPDTRRSIRRASCSSRLPIPAPAATRARETGANAAKRTWHVIDAG